MEICRIFFSMELCSGLTDWTIELFETLIIVLYLLRVSSEHLKETKPSKSITKWFRDLFRFQNHYQRVEGKIIDELTWKISYVQKCFFFFFFREYASKP